MIRTFIALLTIVTLSACGGTRYASQNAQVAPAPAPVQTFDAITGEISTIAAPASATVPARLPFATGPIFRACQKDNRRAASQSRCGCVQAVADQSLSDADQRRGAKYFKDPGTLQEVRQSDNPRNERFWLAWKAFGQDAAAQCSKS